jgi:hypothetical protein
MACPICDQKPMNCDCTPEERRMHAENEDLEDEVTRLRVLIQDAAYLLQGSPVGSGCYEAWQMLTENKQPQDASDQERRAMKTDHTHGAAEPPAG